MSDQAALELVETRLKNLLTTEDNQAEINKVSPEIVKEAAAMMKSHKLDVSQGFSSDALLNAPDILFEQLALIFKDWLTHGRISKTILACALIPLVKANKDPGNSNSYRAIAGSSLILKLFERSILLIWGDKLNSDSLQFGFKKKSSTGMASWIAQEVLAHYLRQGSRPIATVLDCTKAFDLAKFDLIFSRALDCSLPAIVVRVILFSYKEQEGWVRWGRSCYSDTFGFSNSTKQGSVASPPFWSIYIDPLISRLREEGVGCHIGGLFVGVIVYCDDILLLAPSREAAQIMLKTCEDFAGASNIIFSTDPEPSKSKSKCIFVVGPKGTNLEKPAPLVLYGRLLPWVDQAEHLGTIIHQDGTFSKDVRVKRAKFIDQSCKIREDFYFAHPLDIIHAVETYATAFYGSSLWNLNSREVEMIINSWKAGHRIAWGVPRACRSYLVKQVLAPHVKSLEVTLWERFLGFFHSLISGSHHEVATLAILASHDIRTNLGANLTHLKEVTKVDPWNAVKDQLNQALNQEFATRTPDVDHWRPPLLQKLLIQRLSAKYDGNKTEEEYLTTLIDSLTIN